MLEASPVFYWISSFSGWNGFVHSGGNLLFFAAPAALCPGVCSVRVDDLGVDPLCHLLSGLKSVCVILFLN